MLALFLGILPVLLFLSALRVMDSYKLVRPRELLISVAAGAFSAMVAFILNAGLLHGVNVPSPVVTRYLAPVIEEALKASLMVYLIRSHRVGFMVDAGIHGFAIGTGFAVIENLYYAWALHTAAVGLWIARGLGTAILHGSTTAIVGILSKDLTDRHASKSLTLFLPGFGIAVVAHSFYNHLLFNPLLATAALLATMPLLTVVIYERSERATRDWLGSGLDSDIERLELLLEGVESHTPIGEYFDSLASRFSGQVMADMVCLLRIHLELSMRAKGILIARAAGVDLPPDESVRENLEEMRYLERSIGGTGRLAMLPLLETSSHDLWQITMLRR
jgi:RsiW-degrading membrane proteinase PrsW (M82 family)